MEACHAANHDYFGSWQELSHEKKTYLVAHYYAKRMIKSHQEDAHNEYLKRTSKRK
jgi:hypothetical protein